jgi:hypothetical protein
MLYCAPVHIRRGTKMCCDFLEREEPTPPQPGDVAQLKRALSSGGPQTVPGEIPSQDTPGKKLGVGSF